mmetsp:Transcript_12274/g.19032  ORF Transcript_12274/g.19032 Transcript_12274/m.19032 type:complete len:101 (+) Transcript_12274:843-1145(+)
MLLLRAMINIFHVNNLLGHFRNAANFFFFALLLAGIVFQAFTFHVDSLQLVYIGLICGTCIIMVTLWLSVQSSIHGDISSELKYHVDEREEHDTIMDNLN